MKVIRGLTLAALLGAMLVLPASAQQPRGGIRGQVTQTGGGGIGGVTVVVNEIKQAEITDGQGKFAFVAVPPGIYTIILTLGANTLTLSGIAVEPGEITELDTPVDWNVGLAETLTVYSASRRIEKLVDAPASVTVISEAEIERSASHAQLPKLIEFTPGTEITQSGLYDFNINTRGFNSSLNRRVATLIDGRDVAVPFFGAQEWAAVSFPLDDVASLELIRGPSAALYGANASSGIINLTTKQPRYSQGGTVRFTAGELSTTNLDLRFADELGGGWYMKVVGGVRDSGDFSVSRDQTVEYSMPCAELGDSDCLPQEARPLEFDSANIVFGSVRADKYFADDSVMTLEVGTSTIEGPPFQSGIGRVELIDVERPWGRLNYSSEHLNVMAHWLSRDAAQISLQSGRDLPSDTRRYGIEVQGNGNFAGGKGRIVAGAAHTEEKVSTFDPKTGRQAALFEPVESDRQAFFGQLDFQATEKFKFVFAGRLDVSTLHDTQFSPKASVVYGLRPNHSLRLTYNEAFQTPNYSEFFLQVDVSVPQDLSLLEPICTNVGVSCGLGQTRVFGLGNPDLEVEQIRTFELGYSGILGGRAFLTADYYRSKADQFITDLIPQVGTALGTINSNFRPWVGSAAAENTSAINGGPVNPNDPNDLSVADAVRNAASAFIGAQGAQLTNNRDGSTIIAARSYTNFGAVDTQGIDLGLNYYFADEWNLAFSYSWFDFEIVENRPGLEQVLQPNTPENKASLGLSFSNLRWDATLSGRWVEKFRWSVGVFDGDVPSYTTVDLNANLVLNQRWKLGINVANALDNNHYEAFGGDLLSRRALASLTFNW